MQESRIHRFRIFSRVPAWLELGVIAFFALILFGLGGIVLWASLVPIPSISNFENRDVAQSTKIYDRTGNIVLYDVHGSVRRTAVPLDQINPYVREATISIEDASFYQNIGFRPLSFARAMFVDLLSGSYVQGGSTITQQVVKNALLTQNKTAARKIEEIILAIRLTRIYSKDQILNTYLNETPYGGTIYGIEEASQYFFGVDAKDVDLAQSAYLAALPQSPTRLSPYGNHRRELDARKNLVLSRMKEYGYITDDQYKAATKEQVDFKGEVEAGIKAPHFVFYIREYLENKYGVDEVQNGGLRVVTTLDYDLQQKAEATVAKYGPGMKSNFNASNEGMLAIDPKTGQVLAMVGSRDYFNNDIDGQVNVTLANRQPGSSFKPFVYATAFEKGYTPDTVLFDVQTQFSTTCSAQDITNDNPPCYSPQNYDGKFKGPMSLRNAIAQSENIPSVKVLYLAGIKDSIATAVNLGISTLADAARYGLTLVLGGGEVNLLEMTGAYSVFANDGIRNPPTGILEVRDSSGTVLESYADQSQRVLDPQIARQINDILSDNVARTPEFGSDSPLNFPGTDVADKTGTTNDSRDAWIIGYTPGIAVGAWAGNNDNSPMVKRIAAFIVAPMWHEFTAYAIQKYPADSFTPPAPEPDKDSLPPVLRGEWNTDPSKGIHEILYWVKKDNPRSGPPSNPASDSQYAYWDYPVQLWAQSAGYNSGVPGITPPVPTPGVFKITSPQPGAYVSASQPLVLSAQVPNPQEVVSVTYSINGTPVGTAYGSPYTVSLLPISHGPAILDAVAHMNSGQDIHATITFTIQ
jgi:penicillin-binding protein 1C